jgi:hypothetical protein
VRAGGPDIFQSRETARTGARRIHAEIRSDGYVADSHFERLETLKAIQLTDQPKESSRRA